MVPKLGNAGTVVTACLGGLTAAAAALGAPKWAWLSLLGVCVLALLYTVASHPWMVRRFSVSQRLPFHIDWGERAQSKAVEPPYVDVEETLPRPHTAPDMAVLRDLLAVGRLMDQRPPKDALGRIRPAQTDHDILDWRLRVERELAAWPSILDQFRAVAPDHFVLIASGSVEYAGLSGRLKVLEAVVP
jgi:hypothetical protein